MGRIIEDNLYMIKKYNGVNLFYETDNIRELALFVAEFESKGNVVTSVVEVCKDGRTPRVPIKSTKDYKEAIKELLRTKSILDILKAQLWTSMETK